MRTGERSVSFTVASSSPTQHRDWLQAKYLISEEAAPRLRHGPEDRDGDGDGEEAELRHLALK